jgi:ferredoxin-NADP reductase
VTVTCVTESGAAVTVADRYHSLKVKRVVPETTDAVSIVFDVPASLSSAFAYRAGQFVTLRVPIGGERLYRSYSMSSSPATDTDLQVTVKRVPGGVVSNWLNDTVREGDVMDVSTPTGVFVLDDTDDDVVAFAAGSGITPVFSIVKSALHTSPRTVRLLFANRHRPAAIFGTALDELAARFPGRLEVHHHEDVLAGFVDGGTISAFVKRPDGASFYVCGPSGFMDVVETALRDVGVDDTRIHIERFTPATAEPPVGDDATADTAAEPIKVTVTVRNQTKTIDQRGRSTILQSARWGGLAAPSSCEAGHCATCMARVIEGSVEMATNDVLTDEEISEGWVLTCQAVPTSPVVRVVYES